MNRSWQQGTSSGGGARNNPDVMLALEREAETARFDRSWRYFTAWLIPTLYVLFDVFALNCGICALLISSFLRCELVHGTAHMIEITALVICALNLLTYFAQVIRSSYRILTSYRPKLTPEQASLIGITDQSGYNIVQSQDRSPHSHTSLSVTSNIPTPPADGNFLTRWLSALNFGGTWTMRGTKYSSSPSANYSRLSNSRSIGTSYISGKSGSGFSDSTLFRHSTPLAEYQRSSYRRRPSHFVPLSAKVGSRTSPRSPPTSSIQTSKQLEEFLQKSSLSNESSSLHGGGVTSFSTSYGSVSSNDSGERFVSISPPFRLHASGNTSYEVGTAMYDDEQGKVAHENNVVSLVTGSRIRVTEKRISLSPIPLNLIDTSSELTGENAKGIASDGTGVARNADNDSITFRVNYNAAKQAQKKGPGSSPPILRRSESTEQRRHRGSSPSPHTQSGNQQPVNVIQLSGCTDSPTGKQIPITSSEILNKYRMDAEGFAAGERNLRMWICQTIVRPLIAKIDEINGLLTRSYAHLHLKIGHSSVESLQVAVSSKSDLLKSPLPYVLPYLRAHEKQAYLVKRCRELSADICMKNYNWDSGGYETVERKDEDDRGSYSPPERAWDMHLPTDAQLIWSWFAAYMDARMEANPLASDIEMPFSSVYYLKKPARPSLLQCMKKSFYIYQSSINPPHFELVTDGGHERFEIDRGPKNLWRTILLFIQHIRLFNDCKLRNIKIDARGINLACVLE